MIAYLADFGQDEDFKAVERKAHGRARLRRKVIAPKNERIIREMKKTENAYRKLLR